MKKTLRYLMLSLLCAMAMSSWAQSASDGYLDVTQYATIDDAGINTDVINKLYYWDESKGTLVVSVFGAYQSASKQKWVTTDGSGSTGRTWDAMGVFKGSGYYHTSTTAKAATGNTSRSYFFKVKNVTAVSALVKSGNKSRNAVMTVLDGETVVGTVQDNSNQVATLTVNGLASSKVYTVKLSGDASDNSDLYEVAFVADMGKTPVSITFAEESYSVDLEDAFTAPTPIVNPSTITDLLYESSDENVATVDVSSGAVTLVGPGTTTITASFAGDDNYLSASGSYELTVLSSSLVPVTEKFWKWSAPASYASIQIVDNLEINAAEKEVISVDESSKTIEGVSFSHRLKLGGTGSTTGRNVHFKVAGPSTILLYLGQAKGSTSRVLEISDGTNVIGSVAVDQSTMTYTCDFAGRGEGDIYIYSTDSGINIFGIKVSPINIETIEYPFSFNKYGIGTFYYSDMAFEVPDGVTAYVVNSVGSDGVLVEEDVHSIPAGCAVILRGEPNSTVTLVGKKETNDGETFEDNMLRGTDEEESCELVDADYLYYQLSAKDGEVGFYWGAEEGAPFTNGAHKAFLALTPDQAAQAPAFYFSGTSTGISTVAVDSVLDQNAPMYNLAGQRVDKSYKGVVIQNGKKVIKK